MIFYLKRIRIFISTDPDVDPDTKMMRIRIHNTAFKMILKSRSFDTYHTAIVYFALNSHK
jgi:hypothetical protein